MLNSEQHCNACKQSLTLVKILTNEAAMLGYEMFTCCLRGPQDICRFAKLMDYDDEELSKTHQRQQIRFQMPVKVIFIVIIVNVYKK